ncbi:MAG: ABC transporter permease [Bacteroidota bacterium]
MILKIFRFELRSRLKQPLFLLFFALMALQTIWYLEGAYDIYVNDATKMNGAILLYQIFAGTSIIMTILIAVVTGSVLWKDIQYKSASIIYATPINEKSFFAGRFLSAYAINLILGFGMFVGLLVAPFSGIGTPEKFGPTPWVQMFFGFFVLTATNLFIYTAVSISFLVLTRRIASSYLSIFFVTLILFICETLRPESSNPELLQLMDPSLFVYTAITIDTIPVVERNVAFLPLNKLFLLNRTIWLGFSLIMLGIAYTSFSFKRFIAGNESPGKNKQSDRSQPSLFNDKRKISVPEVRLSYRFSDFLIKLISLAYLEIKNVIRTTGFRILILVLSIGFFLFNLYWNSSYFIASSYPLTSTMTLTRISMGIWVSFILMIWTGELLFKDRVVNFWQVIDTLPVPVWVSVFSRFLAMSIVSFFIFCMFIVLGIVAQLLQGAPTEIDFSFYVSELLGYNLGWLNYLQMLALVCLIAGLTAHRYATHLLSIGIYFFYLVSIDLGVIEEARFIYMAVPGVNDYSEMNGYGIWATSIPWFFLLWTSLAIVLLVLGIYFWKRGASHKFKQKFSLRGTQLNWLGKTIVSASLVGFFYLQNFVVNNVHAKGNFESKLHKQEKEAAYEKTYKRLAEHPQPKISGVDLKLDFYPENRSADFEASCNLINLTGQKIDTLYLNFPDFTKYKRISWNGEEIKPAWTDGVLNMMALAIKMQEDTSGVFSIKGSRVHTGFTQDPETPQPELTYNGSFLRAQDLLPSIGYNDDLELMENRYRSDWGLEKLHSRMSPISDSDALSEDVYSHDATWVKGTIELSTASDQVAIALGKLVDSRQRGGRSYFTYSLESSAPFEWYFGSANYRLESFNAGGVQCHIYHKAEHAYNLRFFKNAFVNALSFIESRLSEYPYSEVKLMEIPFYQKPHYAFPNTIAISEKEGWFADSTSLGNRVYMEFTIASNLIAHWVLQNIPVANVQGADMLRYALPEALAMQIIEIEHSEEGLEWLISKKQGLYAKERGNEPNVEHPLIASDGIGYLEKNKGTLALFELCAAMGAVEFNKQIKNWTKSLDANGTFYDLYLHLFRCEKITELSEKDIQELKNKFEKVDL